MKIFLLGSIFLFCSCSVMDPETYTSLFSSSEDTLETLEGSDSNKEEPYILLNSSNEKVNLSQFNRSKYVLNLSDQIFFPFLPKSSEDVEFFSFNRMKQGEGFTVKISSLCNSTVSGDKAVKEFFSFKHKSHFTFLQILPEEVLVSSKEKSFSCSFIFSFMNEDRDSSSYIVSQQPIISSHQNRGLILKGKGNNSLNIYSTIEIGDAKTISLIKQDSEILDRYHFVCNDFVKGISFQLKDLEDSFLLHIFSQENLPRGIKNCRIFSEKLGLIHGMTQLFQVNFNNLGLEAKTLDISKINYEIIDNNKSLTSVKELFGYRPYMSKENPSNYLFSAIRFRGLPKDFYSSDYKDVQVNVQSSCSSGLTSDDRLENHYQFLLTEEFSVMSITPQWFFQLYYFDKFVNRLNKYIQKRNPIQDSIFSSFYIKKERKDMECIYEISLESYDVDDQKITRTLPKISYNFKWHSGSYGVNLGDPIKNKDTDNRSESSKSKEKRSYLNLSDIQEEQGGYFNLVFLNQLANRRSWQSYPDKMTLKCGKENKPLTDLNLDFFDIERLGSSIPLSLIFSHPLVLDYLYENKAMKCRVLFYKDNVLKYFSSELRVFYDLRD